MNEHKEQKHTYVNEYVRVEYFPDRCNHIGRCVRQLKEVFNPEKRPWVDLDQAEADRIVDVVQSCPTGALKVTRLDGGKGEEVPARTEIQTVEGGPFWIRGHIQLKDENGEVVSKETRIALCRCAKSNNQPFCDGSHRNKHLH